MSDKLKLSDPNGDGEVDRVASALEQQEHLSRIQQLEKNIAVLERELASRKASVYDDSAEHGSNNKIGARKHASFKAISTAPSINKTPIGPTMVPIPYPVVQDLSSSVNTARTVKFNSCPVYLLDGSTLPNCTGDERGTGKGVKSGTVSGEVKPVKGSSTVRVEGKQVVRDGDACTMNGGNNPGVYVSTPSPSSAPAKTAIETSNPPDQRALWPKWPSDNPLGLPQPKTVAQKIAAIIQADTLDGGAPLRRDLARLRGELIGPKFEARHAGADSDRFLPLKNRLETQLLGPFGIFGAIAQLSHSDEQKISSANQVGAAMMGVVWSVTGIPGRTMARPQSVNSPENLSIESALDGVKVLGRDNVTLQEARAISSRTLSARIRQYKMLFADVGYNISPMSWDAYPTIGRGGTFVSDEAGILKYFGEFEYGDELTISKDKASNIEADLGLVPGTLKEGFKVRRIQGLKTTMPRSPLEGNQYFLGKGNHLPGGAPELVIDSVPTADSKNARTIITVKVD